MANQQWGAKIRPWRSLFSLVKSFNLFNKLAVGFCWFTWEGFLKDVWLIETDGITPSASIVYPQEVYDRETNVVINETIFVAQR